MKKGVLFFLIAIGLSFSIIGATAPNPGHSANEIGGGTFFGGEDYIFPSTVLVNASGNFSAGNDTLNARLSASGLNSVGINSPAISSNALTVVEGSGQDVLSLGNSTDGDIWDFELNDNGDLVFNSGNPSITFENELTARVGIGNDFSPDTQLEVLGGLCVSDATGDDCTTSDGDIRADGTITQNAFDIAERIWSKDLVEAGDVLVIDTAHPEHVKKSTKPYDTTVAGIFSTDPGNVLGWEDKGNVLLALAGRVPVKVTAENGPIRIGDLLTTSSVPGHAMKCQDKAKCIGAIVGKALESHANGEGTIIALVTLQ